MKAGSPLPSERMQVQLSSGPELPQFSAIVSVSETTTIGFILGIRHLHVLSSPTCASTEGCKLMSTGASACASCQQAPALSTALPFPCSLAIALHRGTPHGFCHSQNRIFP